MALTAGQLNTLRTGLHTGTFYLSVNSPRTLWSAVVNEVPAIGDTDIIYDGGSGTGFADLAAGQRVEVTQADGNIKICRFKSIITGDSTAGTMSLAHNSVHWSDNDTFSVIDDYPLLPYVSRFLASGTFYKDYDRTYTDENASVYPVCIAGPHRVGFVQGGSFAFTADLTSSYAMADGATITGYACSLEPSTGGSVVDNLDGTFDVTITTAGQYWLKCTVTDSNGKSQDSRRRVFAHSTTLGDANYPMTDIQVATLNGDLYRGGYTLNMTVRADADAIVDDALVVLWYVPTVDGVDGSPTQLFAGYVTRDSIRYDWDAGEVRFEAQTIDRLLANQFMYSITLSAVRTPAKWYEYAIWLSSGRIVHHYWRWHSTLFEIADVLGLVDDVTGRKFGDGAQGNLLSMAQSIAKSDQSVISCSKDGRLYYAKDGNLLNTTDRAALDTTFKVTTADIDGDLTIVGQNERVAQVKVSGLWFNQERVEAFCSTAPHALVFERGGNSMDYGRQTLRDQVHADEIAGQLFARENAPYPQLRFGLHGGYFDYLDIIPQAWLTIDIAAADNPRGLSWTNKKMLPRTLAIRIDPASATHSLEITCETEAIGNPGQAINCGTGAILNFGLRNPPSSSSPDIDATRAIAAFSDFGVEVRDDNSVTWANRSPTSPADALAGNQDPFWRTAGKQNSSNYENAIMFSATQSALQITLDAGTTWTDVTPLTDPPNSWSDTPAVTVGNLDFTRIAGDRFTDGKFYMLAEYDNGTNWRGWLMVSADNCLSWTYYPLFTVAPTSLRPLWLMPDGGDGTVLWVTIWKDSTLYLQKWTLATMTFSETSLGAATKAEMLAQTYTAAPFAPLGSTATVYVYGRMNAPAGLTGDQHIIKSTDGGSTFASVESGWSTDRCGAFYEDGAGNMYAVRSP